MSAQRELELRHRLSRAALLREVLKDGAWHLGSELVQLCGWRFGAAVLLVRRGEDGGRPWVIEKERLNGAGSLWRYRFAGLAGPSVPLRESWQAKAKRLERYCLELESRLSALETYGGMA